MIEEFYSLPRASQRLRSGPLGPYVDGFARLLQERGYRKMPARKQLQHVLELSLWLERRHLGAGDLNEQRLHEFVGQRCRGKACGRGEATAVWTLFRQLRELAVVGPPCREDGDAALEDTEQAFTRYLIEERGLVLGTPRSYWPVIRRFLTERFGSSPVRFGELEPSDVTRFVSRHAYGGSSSKATMMTNALRTFLRYLLVRGEISADLSAVVPSVASWRLATVPCGLDPDQVELVLGSCDRTTAVGRRDYAILLLLARLGLRAGEVAKLMLDDIDWEDGRVMVRGKGHQRSSLPLPRDAGAALARYLRRDRPRCPTHHVFIRTCAPRREMTFGGISSLVNRALGRAGVSPPRKGAHLLRHSLATRMLRRGASLREIGDVLRHRQMDTTAIYAKVDLIALRAVTQPWPGDIP